MTTSSAPGSLDRTAGSTRVAVDVLGGDVGLDVFVPAALVAAQSDTRLHLVLVGPEGDIGRYLKKHPAELLDRIEIHPSDGQLANDAKPAAALRRGRGTSMWTALSLVADDQAGAAVSGGSTAALMTLGVKLVGMLPGIDRPALMARVPIGAGFTQLLDLGANVQVSEHQLVQFAVMGAVTAEVADGQERPAVGLLNVGHEDGKGHEVVRAAHARLKELPINYVGFIEGHDIFSGRVQVAVCDGFTGNLVLKSSEGLARMLQQQLRSALTSSPLSRFGAMLAAPALRRMLAQLDPSAHNGAPLLGLRGVVVKSHGGADQKGVTRAILEAGREARRQVPRRIEDSIQSFQLQTGLDQ